MDGIGSFNGLTSTRGQGLETMTLHQRPENRLLLRLFGPPCLLVHGKQHRLTPRKSFELLALIVLAPDQKVQRAEAAALLWPQLHKYKRMEHLRPCLSRLKSELNRVNAPINVDGDSTTLWVEGTIACDLQPLLSAGPGTRAEIHEYFLQELMVGWDESVADAYRNRVETRLADMIESRVLSKNGSGAKASKGVIERFLKLYPSNCKVATFLYALMIQGGHADRALDVLTTFESAWIDKYGYGDVPDLAKRALLAQSHSAPVNNTRRAWIAVAGTTIILAMALYGWRWGARETPKGRNLNAGRTLLLSMAYGQIATQRAGLATSSWPRVGGDNHNSGALFAPPALGIEGISTEPEQSTSLYCNATIGPNGLLYAAASGDGAIYAFDKTTGKLRWRFLTFEHRELYGGCAISTNGILVQGCNDGRLYALDAESGEFKWFLAAKGGVDDVPCIGPDRTVYFSDQTGEFYAVKLDTGEKKWSLDLGDGDPAMQVLSTRGSVYVTSGGGKALMALDSKTGTVLWKSVFPKRSTSSSLLLGPDDTVYVCCLDGVVAYEGSSGELKWLTQLSGTAHGNPMALSANGILVVGSLNRDCYAIEAASGRIVWKMSAAASILGVSIASNSVAYLACSTGTVEARNLSNGELRWKYQLPASLQTYNPPSIDIDGSLFIPCVDGRIHQIR